MRAVIAGGSIQIAIGIEYKALRISAPKPRTRKSKDLCLNPRSRRGTEFEDSTESPGSTGTRSSEQIAVGIKYETAYRPPSVVATLKAVKHRVGPPAAARRRQLEDH